MESHLSRVRNARIPRRVASRVLARPVSHLLASLGGKEMRSIHAIAILMAVLLCGSSAAEQTTMARPLD